MKTAKKVLLTLVGVALAATIYWLGFVNGEHNMETKMEATVETTVDYDKFTDRDLMDRWVDEYYAPGFVGVLDDDDDFEGDEIDLDIYNDKGKFIESVYFTREWYRAKLRNAQ